MPSVPRPRRAAVALALTLLTGCLRYDATFGKSPTKEGATDAFQAAIDALDRASDAGDSAEILTLAAAMEPIFQKGGSKYSARALLASKRASQALKKSIETVPAYLGAGLAKSAMDQFPFLGRDAEEVASERKIFADLYGKLRDVAKPDLVARAEKLRGDRPGTALLYYAQLSALYPEDQEAKKGRDSLRETVRGSYAIALKPPEAADDVKSALLQGSAPFPYAFRWDAGASATLKVTLGEPASRDDSKNETRQARVKRGKKTVPNSSYTSLEKKIAASEKKLVQLRESVQNAIHQKASASIVKSKQNDVAYEERYLTQYRGELAKTKPTKEVDDYANVPYTVTIATRTVSRSVQFTYSNGEKPLSGAFTVTASGSAESHSGVAEANLAPAQQSLPSESSLGGGLPGDAARQVLARVGEGAAAAVREPRLAKLRGGSADDQLEAAALTLLLVPGAPDVEAEALLRKRLQISGAAALLRAGGAAAPAETAKPPAAPTNDEAPAEEDAQ